MLKPKLWCLDHGLISSIHVLPIINNLLHHLTNLIWIAPSFSHMPHSLCLHPFHWSLYIHLLWCSHGNEHIGTHNTFHDVFASITKKVSFSCDSRTIACSFFSHSLNIYMQCQCCPFQRWVKKPLQNCHSQSHTCRFFEPCIFYTRFCNIKGSWNKGTKLQDHHLAK